MRPIQHYNVVLPLVLEEAAAAHVARPPEAAAYRKTAQAVRVEGLNVLSDVLMCLELLHETIKTTAYSPISSQSGNTPITRYEYVKLVHDNIRPLISGTIDDAINIARLFDHYAELILGTDRFKAIAEHVEAVENEHILKFIREHS